jgi:hypothetical protein
MWPRGELVPVHDVVRDLEHRLRRAGIPRVAQVEVNRRTAAPTAKDTSGS